MLVVDTSAVVAALVGEPPNPQLRERLAADGDLHAPHLIDVEVVHVLRRLVHRGDLPPERAQAVLDDLDDLAIVRYPHVALRSRMWELRETLTAYDATFVALAELLGAPLITLDERLARARGHEAQVEVP